MLCGNKRREQVRPAREEESKCAMGMRLGACRVMVTVAACEKVGVGIGVGIGVEIGVGVEDRVGVASSCSQTPNPEGEDNK